MSEVPRGRFCWYDLMTSNLEAARRFYAQLLGWGTEVWEGGEKPYPMWTRNGIALGGALELSRRAREAGVPPHWLGYVAVPSVEQSVETAHELGGQVIFPPNELASIGRFAVIGDPQGAVIALFTAAGGTPGHDGPARPGEFSWHELAALDHRAAWGFYEGLCGWERGEALDLGALGTYQVFGRPGELPSGGMFDKPREVPAAAWLYYVRVADLEAGVIAVERLGGRVVNGPAEDPGGDRVAHCLDPQGAAFALQASRI